MSIKAKELNALYLKEMAEAPENTVLGRIRLLWWKPYIDAVETQGLLDPLDCLDVFMNAGRKRLSEMASDYGKLKANGNQPKIIQLSNQFLKSNTGKMFERFVGLSIAYVLYKADVDYSILPFRKDMRKHCANLANESLKVTVQLGKNSWHTTVDADLFLFNPTSATGEIYLISVKSTLKDRFHNVPFWNLLRQCAISHDFKNIIARNEKLLRRIKYIAVCTDLAEEQPDFASSSGPRNLLLIDASLLDGAYVTASKALGVSNDKPLIGPNRSAAFHSLSSFVSMLFSETP